MKDWNADIPLDERRALEERMREAAKRALQRTLTQEEKDAEAQRRLEKDTLYPLRYGVGAARLKEIMNSVPPLTRWQRFRQWCRDVVHSIVED